MSLFLFAIFQLALGSPGAPNGPNVPLQLTGVRRGLDHVQKLPSEAFSFKLFGKNLAEDGYYFTTATRCEDSHLSTVSTVRATVKESYCSYAILSVPEGLPFNVSTSVYHLCHKNATIYTQKFLVVHEKKAAAAKYMGDEIVFCFFCILMSAYASGMTLGYMKFSMIDLNTMLKIAEGDAAKKRVRRIMHFRRRSTQLVVTFSLFSSVFTVLFTTTCEKMLHGVSNEDVLKMAVPALICLIFAEMIPQAVCNSKFGFNLAASLWFVTVIIFFVTLPIAYPASLVLGRFLKRDVREVMTPEEKTCLLRSMAQNEREKTILENATTFTLKKVGQLMVPIEEVFMLSRSQKLNRSTVLTLVEKGYTRIPVYDNKNRSVIVGMLNMKNFNLLMVKTNLIDEPTVKEALHALELLKDRTVKFAVKYVNIEMNAHLLLNRMKTGDFHFACVVEYSAYDSKVVGIITIEDILEKLIGKIDEINELRVRSSIDDRGDNAVIGWCREAGSDKKYPLPFSQQLRILQHLLSECQVLKSLDIGIMKAKQILSLDRIRVGKKNDKLELHDLLLVIFEGTVLVTNEVETFERVIDVPSQRSSSTVNSQQHRQQTTDNSRSTPVPVLIIGKPLLNRLMKSLGSPFSEPLGPKDNVSELVVVSEEASYFKLRLEDLMNSINGCRKVDRNGHTTTGESLLQTLNSRASTSTSTTPACRTPLSVDARSQDETTPFMEKQE